MFTHKIAQKNYQIIRVMKAVFSNIKKTYFLFNFCCRFSGSIKDNLYLLIVKIWNIFLHVHWTEISLEFNLQLSKPTNLITINDVKSLK